MRRTALAAALVFALVAARQRAVRPPDAPPNGPTFNKEVVRIFQDHCQTCHHPGDIGPISLMDYASAYPDQGKRDAVLQHEARIWRTRAAEVRGSLESGGPQDYENFSHWADQYEALVGLTTEELYARNYMRSKKDSGSSPA